MLAAVLVTGGRPRLLAERTVTLLGLPVLAPLNSVRLGASLVPFVPSLEALLPIWLPLGGPDLALLDAALLHAGALPTTLGHLLAPGPRSAAASFPVAAVLLVATLLPPLPPAMLLIAELSGRSVRLAVLSSPSLTSLSLVRPPALLTAALMALAALGALACLSLLRLASPLFPLSLPSVLAAELPAALELVSTSLPSLTSGLAGLVVVGAVALPLHPSLPSTAVVLASPSLVSVTPLTHCNHSSVTSQHPRGGDVHRDSTGGNNRESDRGCGDGNRESLVRTSSPGFDLDGTGARRRLSLLAAELPRFGIPPLLTGGVATATAAALLTAELLAASVTTVLALPSHSLLAAVLLAAELSAATLLSAAALTLLALVALELAGLGVPLLLVGGVLTADASTALLAAPLSPAELLATLLPATLLPAVLLATHPLLTAVLLLRPALLVAAGLPATVLSATDLLTALLAAHLSAARLLLAPHLATVLLALLALVALELAGLGVPLLLLGGVLAANTATRLPLTALLVAAILLLPAELLAAGLLVTLLAAALALSLLPCMRLPALLFLLSLLTVLFAFAATSGVSFAHENHSVEPSHQPTSTV